MQIEKKNKDEKQTENPSKRKKTEKLHEGKEENVSDSQEKPKKSKKHSVASPEETKEDTVPEKEIPQGLSDREAWDVRSNSYVCP